MPDPSLVVALSAVAVLALLAPGLALAFAPGGGRGVARLVALGCCGGFVAASAVWMLLGIPADIALFQGAIASAALSVVVAVSAGRVAHRGLMLFVAGWLLAVVVPVGFAGFDFAHGWVAVTLGLVDFAGVSQLCLTVGAAAIALALVGRRSGAPQTLGEANGWRLALAAVGILAGSVALEVGAELMLDDATPTLVTNTLLAGVAGAIAWPAVDVLRAHRVTAVGAVSGIAAGVFAVGAATPWLAPASAVIVGLLAAILGALARTRLLRRGLGVWARLLATMLVAAPLGLIFTGVAAGGTGFIYSGQPDVAVSQVTALVVMLSYSVAVSCLLAWLLRKQLVMVGDTGLEPMTSSV